MFITLIGISIISWIIITQAPGSPIALTMDPKVSPKIIEQMEKNYDLDKPIYQQYFLWLKKLFTGRLYSFKDGRPVMEKINERIWNTLLLNLVATLIIFSLAIPLGVFSAKRQYTFLDHLGTFGAFLGLSIPGFWLAYLVILGTVELFGYPVLGMRSFVTEGLSMPEIVLDRIWHLLLPAAPACSRSYARIISERPNPKGSRKIPFITSTRFGMHSFLSSPFSDFSFPGSSVVPSSWNRSSPGQELAASLISLFSPGIIL
jgi:ABC-type dipeptide/oligopeptide/nickel transport system permease component